MASFKIILSAFAFISINTLFLLPYSINSVRFDITNYCRETVWAAAVPGGGRQLNPGETWPLDANASTLPGRIWSRIWARTKCNFSRGSGRCETGDCGGLLECKADGTPPNTLAEYALNQFNTTDLFYISLLDGFNVPMEFRPTSNGCSREIKCSADINGECPDELRTSGGCNNPCTVFNTTEYCCTQAETGCKPTNYSEFFKDRCSNAYSYPDDGQNSVFFCPSGTNYKVVFCPPPGGICGTNLTNIDACRRCVGVYPDLNTCHDSEKGVSKLRWKAIIGSISGGILILFALTTICYINGRRNNSHIYLFSFLQNGKLNNRDIEAFMKNHGSLVPRYSYADVRKITNLFKEKLGQGGFGIVYKGKLVDDRLVAVKILNETKGHGEEFINEVASISRTSHVNVVSLLGFCLERHKRALIYEFMPNGSLDKFIGSENHQNTEQHLECEKLYQIAIGVAQGLEYLHRGCNTRIVHFDIKPHNILLDKDFFPKISDFGLAKLGTRDKSILSISEARGTIGYIAPEVFSRNFGGVSHKSDVYSYGMVLLEMIGEKGKDDSVASGNSEKYFPYWIYKHVELNKFTDVGMSRVEDIEIVKKMAIVGMWCIQTNPLDRPSMSKVIEMLERNTDILEVPPKPFLCSPARSASGSCTLSLS